MTTYSGQLGDFLVQGNQTPGVGVSYPSGWTSWVPPTYPGVTVFYLNTTTEALYAYDWTHSSWNQITGGSSFNPFFDTGVLNVTKPVASSFTLAQNANTGGLGTLANLNSRGIVLQVPGHTSNNDNTVIGKQAVASTSAFTMTAFLQPFNIAYNSFAGVFAMDTAGKLFTFGIAGGNTASGTQFSANHFSALGTYVGTDLTLNAAEITGPIWMKVQLTSGNYLFSACVDGESWVLLATISGSYLTTLQYCGPFLNMNTAQVANNNSYASMNVYSWTNTTP